MTRRRAALNPSARNAAALLAALIVSSVATGCAARGAPSILDAQGSEARRVAGVWWLMFGLAAAVYAVVAGFIVVAVRRGRASESGKTSRISEAAFLWLGGIAVPVVILGVVAAITVSATTHLRKPGRDPLHIMVVGERWWWRVSYPESGVETANEIHVPAGRPLHFEITTADVTHSFWVPQIAGKVDTIPGQTNVLDVRVERPGRYRGQCAEFCGIQHAHMALLVYAEPPATFARWLARQATPAPEPANELAAEGRRLFETSPCAGCHTVRGTSARGGRGPDLTKLASRSTIAALTLRNDTRHLSSWISDAQHHKPGALMPTLSLTDAQRRAIVAYLESLG